MGLRSVSVGWALWRGALPSVDSSVGLLAAAYESRWSRRWVLLVWSCAALFASAGLVVFDFEFFWAVLLVAASWVGLLVAFVSPTVRVASRLAHRVRTGLEGSSPLVRGWAAAVMVFASCYDVAFDGYRPGVAGPRMPSALLMLGWDRVVLEGRDSLSVVDSVVLELEGWTVPPLDRMRVLRVVTAVREVWSSPALEHVIELASLGTELHGRHRVGEFLSSAWLLSFAFSDPALQVASAFAVDTGFASYPDGLFLFADDKCLLGVPRVDVLAPLPPVDPRIAERAVLAMALADGWYDWVQPELRASGLKLSLGHRPALAELLAAVWALSMDVESSSLGASDQAAPDVQTAT